MQKIDNGTPRKDIPLFTFIQVLFIVPSLLFSTIILWNVLSFWFPWIPMNFKYGAYNQLLEARAEQAEQDKKDREAREVLKNAIDPMYNDPNSFYGAYNKLIKNREDEKEKS